MLQQQECWFLYPGKEGQRVENKPKNHCKEAGLGPRALPWRTERHLPSQLTPPESSCSTRMTVGLEPTTSGLTLRRSQAMAGVHCHAGLSAGRGAPGEHAWHCHHQQGGGARPGGRTQRLLRPEEPPHRARHFQYFGWPDYGVLGFRDEVNRAQSSEPGAGPVAVPFRCGGAGPRGTMRAEPSGGAGRPRPPLPSKAAWFVLSAGIGRTGTIIVIDILADVIRRQLEPPQERENQKVGTAPRESGCSPRPASPRAPAVTSQPWTRTCRATGV
ncbi:uncharacterized protein LOC106992466 isoform X1 [Macaca mulatta]